MSSQRTSDIIRREANPIVQGLFRERPHSPSSASGLARRTLLKTAAAVAALIAPAAAAQSPESAPGRLSKEK